MTAGEQTGERLDYTAFSAAGWSITCLQDTPLITALKQGAWPPPGACLVHLKGDLKNSSGLVHQGGRTYFFKRFRQNACIAAAKRLFGVDRARSNWLVARHLLNAGVPTPAPVALLLRGGESWFISEAIPESITLAKLARQKGPMAAEHYARGFVPAIARMHDSGTLHGDLKWGNLLVGRDDRLFIVDLDSASVRRKAPAARVARDLARFFVAGLEEGLSRRWAEETFEHYSRLSARCRPLPALSPDVSRHVDAISKLHHARYGRPLVRLPRR